MAAILWNIQLVVLIIPQLCRGSSVTLDTTPSLVKEGLTPSLDLFCKIKDTPASSSIVGRRDISSTVDNAAAVMSVLLMHNGQDIASVTSGGVAHVMDASIQANVTGSVAAGVLGGQGGEGFLHLGIANPGKNQSGEYVCQANVVAASGHTAVLVSSKEVSVASPTIPDLVNAMAGLKADNEALKKNDQDVQRAMQDILDEMQKKDSDMQKKVDGMQTKVDEMQKKYEDVQKAVAKLETGVFFSVGLTKEVHHQSGVDVIKYDTVFSNVGGQYNVSSGLFTCDTPGFYKFNINAQTAYQSIMYIHLQKNNQNIISVYGYEASRYATYEEGANTVILKLAKGDVVRVVSNSDSHLSGSPGLVYATFNGQLLLTE